MFLIVDWNINPNRNWYVKISDAGSNFLVELFPTETDAINGTNLIASGNGDFGTASEVILVMEDTGSPIISLFNPALTYHLKVTGSDSDPTKIYHLFPFTDLAEINNSIYRSEDLILRRVTKEINEHTHVSNEKTVAIATLIDGLEINDILKINSTKRGTDTDNIVKEITLTGTPKSLTSVVTVVNYSDFTRA